MSEHIVVVVFDFEAETREDAYKAFAQVMDWHREHTEQTVGSLIVDAFHRAGAEAWWFPEADMKHVDGNDRWAYELVPENEV